MMLARSILFLFLFYSSTLLQMVFWMPVFFFLPREEAWKVPKSWAWNSLWLQHLLIGTRYDFRGTEHVPDGEGILVAAKHQSTWETYTMLLFMKDPSYIIKRELMFVPLFGSFAKKMQVIPVNRGKRSEAMLKMSNDSAAQLKQGRQITIYPEGTRKMVNDPPSYKMGITYMYQNTGARILPVALNSGLFWPRNSLRLYRGTCVMEFLPVIEPGLEQEQFTEKLEDVIETKTNELVTAVFDDPEFDGKDRFVRP